MQKNGNSRFFSLKWKTLLLFGLLLVVTHGAQYFIGYNQLLKQFETQRYQQQQYQLSIVNGLIKQSSRLLEQTADTIPLIAENRMASVNRIGLIIKALGQHWQSLQTNWGLTSIQFYSADFDLEGQWGEPDSYLISDKQFRGILQLERPVSYLSCHLEQCYQAVALPILTDGQKNGLLVMVRSLADVIIAFEETTNINLGILKPDGLQLNRPPNSKSPHWSLNVTAISQPDKTLPLINKLQIHHSVEELLEHEVIEKIDGRHIGARIFKLDNFSQTKSPFLILVTDLTEQYQQIEQVKLQSFYSILLALLISTILLFGLLFKQTQRLISVASVLPALTTGSFHKVRSTLNGRGTKRIWGQDELDLLDKSTLDVANQLERSGQEINEKAILLTERSQELERERDFVNELLNTAPIIILTQQETGEILTINRQGCDLLHTDSNKLIGKRFEEILASPPSQEKQQILNDLRSGKIDHLHQEAAISEHLNGVRTIAWMHKYIGKKRADELAVLTVGLDITEQKDAEAHLIWMADHDPLTNLYNRRRFQSEFEKHLRLAERYQKAGALLYFDLDQFKYVNDTSGHKAGDTLLKIVSETLQQVTRTSDTLARLGGDEFALLMPETDAEGATLLSQKILDKLRGIEFQYGNRIHNISASIGIALFPEHGSTIQDFMAHADLAMYQAKEAGRGRWHRFAPEDQAREQLKNRVLWKEKIESALLEERFILHYQPILDIKNDKISHCELLIRMIGNDNELIMPGDFIPTAEHTGLINQLDKMVLKLAFQKHKDLQRAGSQLKLSINLSGRAFDNPELLSYLKDLLGQPDVAPEKLIFEVTETTAVANFSSAREMMLEIKRTGAKFALDDFGVGFSSFYYLRQLPVDYVKIDGSFIRHLAKHKEDQILVRAIAEIAHTSGKLTIAEFVEDQAILDLISSYGIDYAQGYHLGKPSAEIPLV